MFIYIKTDYIFAEFHRCQMIMLGFCYKMFEMKYMDARYTLRDM